MSLELPNTADKEAVFTAIGKYLDGLSLRVTGTDFERPWGGFFVIDEDQADEFIDRYFPTLPKDQIEKGGKLSPKILVVAPGKRLSWQYHHRREELWRIVEGPVGVITSETDEQSPAQQLQADETIQFGTEIRHRLVGLESWGVVAEIWQHTDPENPSNEEDIIRVSDDFSRK